MGISPRALSHYLAKYPFIEHGNAGHRGNDGPLTDPQRFAEARASGSATIGMFLARRASSSARSGSSMPSAVIWNVPKCMPMLSRGLKIQVRLHGFRRIHVNGLHEPARFVRANRQQRQIDRPEPLTNVAEERRVCRIAGEEDAAVRRPPARTRSTARGFDRMACAQKNAARASA